MKYLLDTNIVSEFKRLTPNPLVVDWLHRRQNAQLFISVLTLGEIRKGIEKLPSGRRQIALGDWLETEIPLFFKDRILPLDARVCDRWGRVLAAAPRSVPAIDSLLAATAIEHGLTLATRNLKYFSNLPVNVVDPWAQP